MFNPDYVFSIVKKAVEDESKNTTLSNIPKSDNEPDLPDLQDLDLAIKIITERSEEERYNFLYDPTIEDSVKTELSTDNEAINALNTVQRDNQIKMISSLKSTELKGILKVALETVIKETLKHVSIYMPDHLSIAANHTVSDGINHTVSVSNKDVLQ